VESAIRIQVIAEGRLDGWDEAMSGAAEEIIAEGVQKESGVFITLPDRSPFRELWIVQRGRVRFRHGGHFPGVTPGIPGHSARTARVSAAENNAAAAIAHSDEFLD
jgi:hypothetical protein